MSESGTLTPAILTALREAGALATKIHRGPLQPMMLDVVGHYHGRYFEIEIKVPGETATSLQRARIKEIERTGGIAAVVHSAAEALAVIGT